MARRVVLGSLVVALTSEALRLGPRTHHRTAGAPLRSAGSDVDGGAAFPLGRRAALVGGALSVFSAAQLATPKTADYGLWGVLPVGPYKSKRTAPLVTVAEGLYTLDQKFGILDVQVPVRTVIVALSEASGGGLWVYNPVAPTREFLGAVKSLEDRHGPVRHVVLGTVAVEHKVYAGVFAQSFPGATVWLTPGQYAVPVDLPPEFLGFPRGRTRTLPATAAETPWAADLDQRTLGPFISRDGAFGETAFFHRRTKTLLVTDTVVSVDDVVPAVYTVDLASKAPLLYHARSTVTDVIDPDDDAALRRGWRRVQLFGLYFQPEAISVHAVGDAIRERRPDINGDFAGIYPWDWVGDDVRSFEAIRGGLLVAPILQAAILDRNPVEVLDWADAVAAWPFRRVIPAHLANDIPADGKAFRRAFSFLEEGGEPRGQPKPLDGDIAFLRETAVSLEASGAIAPAPGLLAKNGANRAALVAKSRNGCRGGICGPRASADRPSPRGA